MEEKKKHPPFKTFFPGVIMLSTVGFFATDAYIPSFPYIVIDLATTKSLVQLTLSFYFLSFALSQIYYGPLSEKYGRRKIAVFGILFSLVGNFVCIFAPDITTLIIGRFLQGLAFGAGSTVFRAILRDAYSGKELAFYGSFIAIGTAFMMAIAPAIGGYIQHYFNWRINFVAALIYSLITLVWIWKWLPETNAHFNPDAMKIKTFIGNYLHILKNPIFIGYSFCSWLALAGIEAFYAVSPFLLEDVVGLTPIQFGWLAFITGGGIGIGGVLNSFLVKVIGRHRMLLIGIALVVLSGVIMLLFGYLGYLNTYVVMGPILIYMIGSAPIFAGAFAGAFQPFAKMAGFAGALYSGFQMLGGAIVTAIVSGFHTQNQIPLGYILLILGILAYFAQVVAFRYSKKANMI